MDPKVIAAWGAIVVSAVALITFLGALIVSFFFKDAGLLNLTIGAAIANATTAVGFWLGSSAGSQKKDDTIQQQAERLAPPGAPPSVPPVRPVP